MGFSKGNHAQLWADLRRNADPALRSKLIYRLAGGGVSVKDVIHQIGKTTDAGERAALILSVGGFGSDAIAPASRKSIIALLIGLYRNDPDSEVHSAVDWLLRHTNEGAARPRMNWGQQTALEEIDREVAENSAQDKGWSVNFAGLTMIVIHESPIFQMGANPNEPRRSADEVPHKVRIPRVFAISSKEVTMTEFQKYMEDSNLQSQWREAVLKRFPVNPDGFWSEPERRQVAVTGESRQIAQRSCLHLLAAPGSASDFAVVPLVARLHFFDWLNICHIHVDWSNLVSCVSPMKNSRYQDLLPLR